MHTFMHVYVCVCTLDLLHMHTHTYTRTHAHTHERTYTRVHTYTNTAFGFMSIPLPQGIFSPTDHLCAGEFSILLCHGYKFLNRLRQTLGPACLLPCSYHGWEFTNEGTCSKIPQIGDPKVQVLH